MFLCNFVKPLTFSFLLLVCCTAPLTLNCVCIADTLTNNPSTHFLSTHTHADQC